MNLLKLAVAGLLVAVARAAAADDLVLADFEGKDYGNWQIEGTAFGAGPAQGSLPHQKSVGGFLGHGLANSYHGGDKATGTLTSPDFVISRKFISFLIGGGGHPGKTCLNLLVDGQIVRTATGPNTTPGGSEDLTPDAWNVAEFAGRTARLQIVDQFSGTWGHINVDQIVLTDQDPAVTAADGELLYNGIRLPKQWPPRIKDVKNRTPRPAPWLVHPPAVIPIDVGRQLFVDDFLIEQSNLPRTFHQPERYAGNPVLKPETPLELNGGRLPSAAVFQDGVWFDPQDRLFKMWYHAGWFDGTALATSRDGLHWERPQLDVVKGTNRVLPPEGHGQRDGCAVWLDHFASDPAQRFKMFLYERPEDKFGGQVFTSPDGVHWAGPKRTQAVGDNTSLSYNPFRKKWIYSVRTGLDGRTRSYRECDDFVRGAKWRPDELVFWAGADALDLPDPAVGDRTQLYNLDAIAYESLMLGVFAIHRGPANEVCAQLKLPKLTDLTLAYSRDGFNWHRPDHTAFLAATRQAGDWDRAYLHSAATICAIVGDKLYFYYSAFSGISPEYGTQVYAGAATGVAMLRRDGFASLDAGERSGTLTTRPLTFKGKHLFVNLYAPKGELRAEVLDEAGRVIAPFSADNCVPVTGDSTRQRVTWKGADDLAALSGKPVRVRFHLTRGQLYAFWVTPDLKGASFGYVAAGGPEYSGPTDAPVAAKQALSAPDPVFDIDPAAAAQNQHYGQPDRPQFHYTPIQGHIGDATGLIYSQGEYHLFYMSDKWERRRNRHKCWGHAVSRDLLHWEELPSVLDPELDHRPGSGCGLVDFNNTLKLERDGEKTLAICYTDYHTGSCLAYSQDAGRTWTRHPRNPILPGTKDIRDPKVFWHEPAQEWRMLRYEDKGFVFYGSSDLFHWRQLSRVEGFYECPDFFELPVEGAPGQRKWVLVGADAGYRLGSFDGTSFQPETDMLYPELGRKYYAPQTWTSAIDGTASVIQMGFIPHEKGTSLTWHNQMAFPVTLTLRQTPDGIRLHREPIAGIAQLRTASKKWQDLTVKAGDAPCAELCGDRFEVRADIDFGSATAFTLNVRGKTIRYTADGKLAVNGAKADVAWFKRRVALQLLVDRSSVELFLDHGRVSVSKCVFFEPAKQGFSLASEGGTLRVVSLEVNQLKSVWPDAQIAPSVQSGAAAGAARVDKAPAAKGTALSPQTADGELLYNGIRLPAQWPPRLQAVGNKVMPVPYLADRPAVVPIDVGRQLFVDDFLVANTDLKRQFHYPERYAGNPILKPETPTELGAFAEKERDGNTKPVAAMISDGFCYDPQAQTFKLWYQAGWRDGTMLALSKDGLHWTRPETDIEKGNNRVLPKLPGKASRHGTGVCFDPFTTDLSQRYKMLSNDESKTHAYTSADGMHWALRGDLPECGDNATAFYNPFREKWVLSLRVQRSARNGRARNYREHADFLQAIHWTPWPDSAAARAASSSEEYEWAGTDPLDLPDPDLLAKIPNNSTDPKIRSLYGDPPQLYNLDAVAYESVMIGMFGILRGPTTGKVWDQLKCVKRNDLHLAYSRDGFHWDRPDRTPFLACTRTEGDWENGYLHAGVGVMCVVADKLYFYYSGWSGAGPKGPSTYAGGATGVAILRRDGFASMDAGEKTGTLTTRPLTFKGKHLFVNLDAPKGELRAEVLDEAGRVIAPFTADNCVPVTGDSTRQRVTWKGADDLAALSGKPVTLRFHLTRGQLYAFWVTPDPKGASFGYVAAGGPEFSGPLDVPRK